MVTSTKGRKPKTPPSKGHAEPWKSPRKKSPTKEKATERERGGGPVGRGGKMGGKCRPSTTSSESESDEDDESIKEGKRHRALVGMKTSNARRSIENPEGERANYQETTGRIGLTATATCSQKHQIFIVDGWCYYTEGGWTTAASDESGCQMTGRHTSKINESGL